MIRFSCPTCRAALKVPPKLAGKTAPCPNCDDRIKIPLESEVDDTPAPRRAPSAPRIVPKPKPKPADDDDVVDDGFEVIDEEPKPKPAARARKPKPRVEEGDDDYEDDDRPVRRRKKLKRKRTSGGFMGEMEEDNATFFKFLAISCGIIALFGALLFVNFLFSIPLYLVLFGFAIYNLVWTIIICNREGGGLAVLLIFLGPAHIINLVRYWNPLWKTFVYSLATTFVFYAFLLAALFPALEELKNRNDIKQQQINQMQQNARKR